MHVHFLQMGDFGGDDKAELHSRRGRPNDRRVDSFVGYAQPRTRQGNEKRFFTLALSMENFKFSIFNNHRHLLQSWFFSLIFFLELIVFIQMFKRLPFSLNSFRATVQRLSLRRWEDPKSLGSPFLWSAKINGGVNWILQAARTQFARLANLALLIFYLLNRFSLGRRS